MEFFHLTNEHYYSYHKLENTLNTFKRYLVYLKYVWTVKQRMFIIPLLSFILNASFYVIVLLAAKKT